MKRALVFGENEYARQIARQLKETNVEVTLYVSDASKLHLMHKEGFDSDTFDFGDDWDDLVEKHDFNDLVIFSALDDDAQNIFLTISLRASFEQVYIIALAKNQESANKLKMAGADKVLPIMQMTANLIVELLEKPIVTDLLHEILYEREKLEIAQVTVGDDSPLIGKRMHDIDWKRQYDIIVLAIVDMELHNSFIFTSRGYNHHIDPDDILIIIGYDAQIAHFKETIGGRSETDWHRRSR